MSLTNSHKYITNTPIKEYCYNPESFLILHCINLSHPQTNTLLFLSLRVYYVLELQISGITQYVFTYASFFERFLRFISLVACISRSFFFYYLIVLHCIICSNLFIFLPSGTLLDCFQFGTIINEAAIKILLQVLCGPMF